MVRTTEALKANETPSASSAEWDGEPAPDAAEFAELDATAAEAVESPSAPKGPSSVFVEVPLGEASGYAPQILNIRLSPRRAETFQRIYNAVNGKRLPNAEELETVVNTQERAMLYLPDLIAMQMGNHGAK